MLQNIFSNFVSLTILLPTIFFPNLALEEKTVTALPEVPASWQVKSIDTQIVSKCWNDVPKESINEQISLLKELGANYIAIGTPYDHPKEMEKWVDAIHAADMHVWFRSHWLNWEGDEGQTKNLSPDAYLFKTKNFIIDHPNYFKDGDAFSANIEAENAGIENGPFGSWTAYQDFLIKEIDVSNEAFNRIGLNGKIHTNWLSMNGWVVQNELTKDLVDKIGIITVDHYVDQNQNLTPAQMAAKMSKDLDSFYQKWHKPILIGEWGYHISKETNGTQQEEYLDAILNVMKSKLYVIGINYWDHMGNTSRIIDDRNGGNLSFRSSAAVIRKYFSR